MNPQTAEPEHAPVLRDRCVELLLGGYANTSSSHQGVVVDATLGLGGHTRALLEQDETVQVIGVDRDPAALDVARQRLADFGARVRYVRAEYDDLPRITEELAGNEVLSGMLFDLGVSSMQLNMRSRGFAYSYDAPLDMRMDSSEDSADISAAEYLAEVPESELYRVIKEYGEERFASRISAAIVRYRKQQTLKTTAELAQIVDQVIPQAAKKTGGHPAKRTFQAIRIAVNAELEILERALPAALNTLSVGGRVVVLSYHSLEDRMVKKVFNERTSSSAPAGLPVELPEHRAQFQAVVRKIELPHETEIRENPRAASAKLRAIERISSGTENKV